MPDIERSALVPYPPGFMYQVVCDVAAYPQFLPWCGDARVHNADVNTMEASILINKAGLNQWFKTRNSMVPDESIEMTLLEGPFKELEGRWQFSPLEGNGCKIELRLHFEIRRGLASAIIAPAFSRIANTMVDSFCARARELHER